MSKNLRSSINTGLNSGLRQSISGGVNGLGFFRAASLDLQFASKKTLNDRVSSSDLITFSRASAGTYVDSNGLIKTTPVNLLTYSDAASTPFATSFTVSTIASVTNPDGSTGTTKLAGSGSLDNYRFGSTNLGTSGTTYTASIHMRAVSGTATVQLDVNDLNASTVTLTEEWQRYSVTATSINSFRFFDLSQNGTTQSGDFLIWGVQLEEGSTPTDYIPTSNTIFGAPRFDHDPVTGESLGLLIEEARTNFQEHSVVSSPNGWAPFRLTLTANQETAPDNSSSAALITEDTTNNSRFFIGSSYSFTSGKTYCNSMFFKAGTLDLVQLTLPSAAFGVSQYANFDLTNGVVTTEVDGTAFIESYQNGWYRCSFAAVATTTASASAGAVLINSTTDGRVPQYIGVSRNLFVWGVQLEEGSFPSSYVPTEGSTATRAADIAEITGANFSGFHNASEGTYIIETGASGGTNSSGVRGFMVSDGATGNRIGTNFKQPTTYNMFVSAGGILKALASNIAGLPRPIKAAIAYKAGDYRGAYDGQLALTSSLGSVPVVNQMSIGSQSFSSDGYFNGHIKRLAYFPTRLPDVTLQNITT